MFDAFSTSSITERKRIGYSIHPCCTAVEVPAQSASPYVIVFVVL